MSGIATARTIDLHAHAVLEETFGTAGRFGPELGADADGRPWYRVGDYVLHGVRYRGSPFMDPEVRLARMEQAGIDFQVLSPNPLTYFHFIPAPEAIAFCTRHNDVLAGLVRRHPDRFGGLAALPMQDPQAACEELRRAVGELGLWGAYIGTDLPLPLDAPALDALYATCVELDVPLFIHPAPAGIDGPPGDPALKRFDLDLVTGFAAQETLAVATLVFGGVLERHPRLDVCISHGGGNVAFLAGRLAAAGRQRPWSPPWTRRDGGFEAALRRLWFDAHLPDARALAMLEALVGRERLVYGTNFAGWDQPARVEAGAFAGALADNARRLLRRAAA
ncbi:MAG: amidohydrolase [Burkholderiales bacterium]|nr:amidohydrolase [Burkholderiales bacterium]